MKLMHLSLAMVLIVCTFAASTCQAFPRPPLSLDSCWQSSSLVVFADVVEVTAIKSMWNGQESYQGDHIVLAVRDVLKTPDGEAPKTINVSTTVGGCLGYFCDLRKGTQVLAFLHFDDEEKMYTPVACPEGCIEVDEAAYRQYASVLKKLPPILNEPDESTRQRRLIEWLVECAVHPITREQGAIGLATCRGKLRDTPNDPLTAALKAKLVAVITSESPPHESTALVVSELNSFASPELDRYLLESLRRSHVPGWEDLTRTAMDVLPDRLGIELKKETRQRRKEWSKLLNLVFYRMDKQADPERYESEKERYHVVWGSLSYDVYMQCKDAVESRKWTGGVR